MRRSNVEMVLNRGRENERSRLWEFEDLGIGEGVRRGKD